MYYLYVSNIINFIIIFIVHHLDMFVCEINKPYKLVITRGAH